MPVYEQKLISPLAIRFTQEHIRTTFQDGRIVEDSIEEIDVRPAPAGSDYDLVLKAPFPAIEILRWRHPKQTSKDKNGRNAAEHWFTLDNRRLYCLQRTAMEHWPSRVAAEVDILYNDNGSVWKKYDSTSFGHAVSIGHSFKGPQVDFWDWCMEAEASMSEISDAAAWQAASRDDQRATIDALKSAEGDSDGALPSSVLRLLQVEDSKPNDDRPVTPSTSAVGSHDLESSGAADRCSDQAETSEADGELDLFVASGKNLARGVWQDEKGTSYTISVSTKGQGDWVSSRQDTHDKSKSVTFFYDWDYDLIWWGKAGAFFASASELNSRPDCLRWYGSKDEQMRKPKFAWSLQDTTIPCTTDRLAQKALKEIMESLDNSENEEGYVWIEGWNERYGKRGLGQLKVFLEQYPDTFCVTSKRGKAFSVALV